MYTKKYLKKRKYTNRIILLKRRMLLRRRAEAFLNMSQYKALIDYLTEPLNLFYMHIVSE